MLKKTLALIFAIILIFSVSSCKEEKTDLTETQKLTSTTEVKQTEIESSTESVETQTTKPTQPQTKTETTTRETTTVLPTIQEDIKTSLEIPKELYLYNNGKSKKVISEQISKIVPQINMYLNDTKLGVLKLAVTEDMIETIKSESKVIELAYDSEQTYVLYQRTGGPNKYKFEKILIPIEGERKGYVFFFKDGTYMNGPLYSTQQKAINEIAKLIK